jgi:lactate dehydrogenase-like 2-hydroxyacid dehydrogenase
MLLPEQYAAFAKRVRACGRAREVGQLVKHKSGQQLRIAGFGRIGVNTSFSLQTASAKILSPASGI